MALLELNVNVCSVSMLSMMIVDCYGKIYHIAQYIIHRIVHLQMKGMIMGNNVFSKFYLFSTCKDQFG